MASGFSLIELLAVIAIMSLLATLVTPAVSSISSGMSTSQAMDVVTNSAAAARQTAMTTGVPVAMVVSKPSSSAEEGQGVLLLSYPGSTANATWIPKGNWTKLSPTVRLDVFQRGSTDSFYANGAGIVTDSIPIKLNGKTVTDYNYIVFYPNGSVDSPVVGPAVTLRRLKKSGTSADYTVVVQSDSGRAKVIEN